MIEACIVKLVQVIWVLDCNQIFPGEWFIGYQIFPKSSFYVQSLYCLFDTKVNMIKQGISEENKIKTLVFRLIIGWCVRMLQKTMTNAPMASNVALLEILIILISHNEPHKKTHFR